MCGGYSAMQHDIIKTISHWENLGRHRGQRSALSDRSLLLSCYICSAQVKLHWCQPSVRLTSGGWSQWCLKGWDHFSINCTVGQCKGHLSWQSGRCCCSVCLSFCLSTYLSVCFHSFLLVGFPFCLSAQLSVIPEGWRADGNWGSSWFVLVSLCISAQARWTK